MSTFVAVRAADMLAKGRAEAGLSQLDTAVCYGRDLHAVITQVFMLDFVVLYNQVAGHGDDQGR